MTATLLIVDDDPGHLEMLSTLLGGWGYHIETADNGELALEKIRAAPYDLVLLDVRMAGMNGIETMQGIKEHNPAVPVIIMTAYSSVDNAVEALKTGAYDYLTKPLDFDVLQHTLQRALDHVRLASENATLRQHLPAGARDFPIMGKSRAMQDLMDLVATVAPTEATVLITGPSGTGKELVAKAIHAGSERSRGPLVTVNCAALKDSLLESELFGHEKGAFTGAERRREGKFMQAHTGSIFLDEITEIPMAMQAKLLRVIQEREIERVGGDRPLHVDVRIIAATNRDLTQVVEDGDFREDLYHRLNVFRLDVPALRDREGDVPVLAQHFLQEQAEKNRKEIKGFTPQAMDLLVKHDWPGNVRELENAVERAVILATGEYITPRELPLSLDRQEGNEKESAVPGGRNLEEIEREAVRATLRRTGGNKSEAARILGITRATLHKKLKRYGIEES